MDGLRHRRRGAATFRSAQVHRSGAWRPLGESVNYPVNVVFDFLDERTRRMVAR